MSLLGLNEKDLYEISLKDYIDLHPELKIVPKDIQNKRYEHYNARRLKSIEEAKKLRVDLLDSEQKEKDKEKEKEKEKETSRNFNTIDTDKSKNNIQVVQVQSSQDEILKKEQEKLLFIKKQVIGEIKNMIERQ